MAKKTKKQLQNQISYQRSKVRKVAKDLERFKNPDSFDKRSKIKITRNIQGLKKGKAYKYKTIYNAILNEGTKINSKIDTIHRQLKNRFSKAPKMIKYSGNKPNRDQYRYVVGRAWDNKDIENAIFKNPEISHINGINIKKDSDKVNDILNKFKLRMGSTDNLVLIYDDKMNGKLAIINDDELEESENEY